MYMFDALYNNDEVKEHRCYRKVLIRGVGGFSVPYKNGQSREVRRGVLR